MTSFNSFIDLIKLNSTENSASVESVLMFMYVCSDTESKISSCLKALADAIHSQRNVVTYQNLSKIEPSNKDFISIIDLESRCVQSNLKYAQNLTHHLTSKQWLLLSKIYEKTYDLIDKENKLTITYSVKNRTIKEIKLLLKSF